VILLALALAAADTLVVGVLADPVSLDPHRATDLVSAVVAANVCETLVRYREDGSRAEAALATDWASDDGRTWNFTLRPGVRFHDGRALDADAVVANLDRLRAERGFPGRAQRLGPSHVALTLERPNAALLATLSQPFFCMLSPASFASGFSGLVGTGPFRVAAAAPGRVELAAHDKHWAAAPRLRRVVFQTLPSADALAGALRDGSVDVTSSLGPERLSGLQKLGGVSLGARTGLNLAFLLVNNERAPFRDAAVRLALARAVDRAALVKEVLGGHAEPARNPLPPGLWGYARLTKELTFDPAGAQRMLARAGHPKGLDTTLLTVDAPRPYMPDPLKLAARLRDDLGRSGVRARVVQAASWTEYLQLATSGRYDLAVLGWQADTMDPNDFLSALLASDSIGSTNRSCYHSATMDSLLEQGRRGATQRERVHSYEQAQALFQKDMPWIPLYHVSTFTAQRRAVRGLTEDATAILRFDHAWKAE
jgi:peptide/nickel transport system substrate-binding protein